jgi:hypothetical protein
MSVAVTQTLKLSRENTMYIIAIILGFIGTIITAGGAIAWVCALLDLIATTPMDAFMIMVGGAATEVIAVVMFFAFRPTMADVGSMMGNSLSSMMEGMEKGLNKRDPW